MSVMFVRYGQKVLSRWSLFAKKTNKTNKQLSKVSFVLFVFFKDRSHRVGKVHTGRGPKPNRKHRDIIVIWFDFCFTALRHILGHFGCGQLPSHTVPGQAS